MTIRFACVTTIAAPPELVFDLALDQEVTWRASHVGIPFSMASRVVDLQRPTRFVDEQVRGPFRRLHHEHRFEATTVAGRSGTRMIDTVSFDAPCGALGRVIESVVLGRSLRTLLAVRNDHLRSA